MDNFVRQRNDIVERMKAQQLKKRRNEKELMELNSKILEKEDQRIRTIGDIKDLSKILKEKNEIIISLKNYVKRYKEKKKIKLKSKFEIKIVDILKSVNKIEKKLDINFEKPFNDLKLLLEKSKKFPKLNKKIKLKFEKFKNELKTKIINKIQKTRSNLNEVHEFSLSLTFLIKYEDFFNEDVLAEFIYKNIYDGFSFHFLSEKKTNRLDRPEWFFDYLIENINEYDRDIKLYNISNKNRTGSIEKIIFDKFSSLIDSKFKAICLSKSLQKRNLILHFCNELKKFKIKVEKKFKINFNFKNIVDIFLKEEKENIDIKIENVHLGSYKKWFSEYKSIFKESYTLYSSLVDLEPSIIAVLNQHIADNLYIYCETAVEQIRFGSKDEINFLCQIFSEIENIKEFLAHQENEFVLGLVIKNEYETVNMSKISKFNSENLKLIKSMAICEIERICKSIKNFRYISDKAIASISMEILNLLNEYQKNMDHSFNVVESAIGEILDSFLLDKIVMTTRLELVDFFRFRDFFNSLKSYFKHYRIWKTSTGCKCIKDIFNGRKEDPDKESLFSIISRNYVE